MRNLNTDHMHSWILHEPGYYSVSQTNLVSCVDANILSDDSIRPDELDEIVSTLIYLG